ncbi:hypothetical protein EV424DRAFT_1351760 [Suillus variegatus]|nr:hypothetical protein EV424DRAFT_1351760 [Suillus variegatus]
MRVKGEGVVDQRGRYMRKYPTCMHLLILGIGKTADSHWAWIEPRIAKKKVMERAIWMPEKSARKVHQQKAPPNPPAKRQRTFGHEDDGDDSSGHGSDSEDLRPEKTRGCPKKLFRTYAMCDVTAMFDSDEDLEDKPNGIDTDADCEESEGEEPEATALMLSDEKVPSLVTNNVKPVQSHGNSQSARKQKQAEETPMWCDVDNAVSESVEESTTRGDSLEPHSSDIEVVPKVTSATQLAQMTASLIQTEKGNVKLLDQNLETQLVVQDAIIDAKGHVIFINAYPELIDKNQVSLQSLLTVAKNRGIKAIKKRLQTDAQYAAHLGSLVEPWIPLLRRDLKVAACANIDSYFCLSNNIVKAKKLMEQHAYVYALRFDLKIFATLRSGFFIIFPYLRSFANTQEQSNDDALPIGKKPYQGELLIFLLHNRVFDGVKSVGVRFAVHFVEIARNKCNCPEVPIPLLALVATAIYVALFWETLGSPGKFNFSGNQFSETYIFHVKFLEGLKKNAPGKFHCMMADIFKAVQALEQKGNDQLASEHQNALLLLDLDGMADD